MRTTVFPVAYSPIRMSASWLPTTRIRERSSWKSKNTHVCALGTKPKHETCLYRPLASQRTHHFVVFG